MNISSDFVRNTMCAIFLGYSCWFVIGLSLPFKSFMFDCHYRRLRWTSWSESKASRFKVTPSTNYLGMSGIPWNIPSLFSHSMICRERWAEDDSQLLLYLSQFPYLESFHNVCSWPSLRCHQVKSNIFYSFINNHLTHMIQDTINKPFLIIGSMLVVCAIPTCA